jgi:4-hydroxy-tetrahydrodipicolinate synthase
MTKVRAGFPETLRLPMTSAGETSRVAIDIALSHAGLI